MKWLSSAILLALLAVSTTEAARDWIGGAETGGREEFASTNGGPASPPTAVTSPIRSGAYSFNIPPGAWGRVRSPEAGSPATGHARFYFLAQAYPSVAVTIFDMESTLVAPTIRHQLWIGTDGILFYTYNNGATIATGSTAVPLNEWVMFQVKHRTSTTVGGLEVIVNGKTEISSFTNNVTSGVVNFRLGQGNGCVGASCALGGQTFWYDDVSTSSAGYPGSGRIIARQGIAGTPTDDGLWALVSCSTIDECWSETPRSTTKRAAAVGTHAQTMIVAPFSITQSGHGTDVVGAHDEIQAVNILFWGGWCNDGPPIRRRVNGGSAIDTLANAPSSGTRQYYLNARFEGDGEASDLFTDTPANLDLYEIGAVGQNCGASGFIDDIWMIVEYSESHESLRLRPLMGVGR